MKPPEAHAAVAKAKREGVLVQGSCEFADETCYGRIEAHHDDYDKPLDVRWLCVRHHGFVHRGTQRGWRKKRFTEQVKIRLEKDTLRTLERLARDGDRTVQAEMRRALRLHILANLTEEDLV